MSLTRGERNNNPGNLREGRGDATQWRGERATDDDPAFEEFGSRHFGLRALALTLLTYQRKHGLVTVRGIITRWAPPGENQTSHYVTAVAQELQVDPDAEIELDDDDLLVKLVVAIIRQENGRVIYSELEVRSAVSDALS